MKDVIKKLLPEAEELLCKLIEVPSVPGEEAAALKVLEDRFRESGIPSRRVPMNNSLKTDPAYSGPIEGINYDGRYNLHLHMGPDNKNTQLVINAHLDVVPASEGMDDAFNPKIENGIIYGRGACDDKGPAVSVWLACAALKELGLEPSSPVALHFVCEEENGGNGTLAMVREKEPAADACVVMEPTSLHPVTSVRGAVWFRIRFHGTAGHSGSPTVTRSALNLARQAMTAIEDYHLSLKSHSIGFPLFDQFENPMPLTFGRLTAGNWPAAAPNNAVLEGVIGFLPNRTADQVCEEMRDALISKAGLSPSDFLFETTYRHDSSVAPENHWIAESIQQSGRELEAQLQCCAFPASCDAVFYSKELSIPTVVFGPGNLLHAHSKDEQIQSSEIGDAAYILAQLMLRDSHDL